MHQDSQRQRTDKDQRQTSAYEWILKLWWNGEWYEVPSMAAFHEWTMDSVCPTPDGDDVEPDHEDSWLRLAGLV
jgi:hypothetical protein